MSGQHGNNEKCMANRCDGCVGPENYLTLQLLKHALNMLPRQVAELLQVVPKLPLASNIALRTGQQMVIAEDNGMQCQP